MNQVERLEGWLERDNLKGFLLMVSEMVEYRFGSSDWGAFQAGLELSDQGDTWFDYPLVGRVSVQVEISRFDEEGDVEIKVSLPAGEPCLRERVRAV
ncbi:hypothetical protein HUT18_06330 [Streptomyces sp. NA04227]|uniref:hypothetical protein n=1 Tax=Streptomyces sp. NA04227 TaxID=2742136 RepID=UPI0015908F46|nr:hypothetical protein [Streptomyces sp. NA04227]QKW06072.1 hypothetical protein HUT18_06330 [Streptomyces sp. NA04227]